MKSKLKEYVKDKEIAEIAITYGKETFAFNLFDELIISEAKLQDALESQPSYYAFLGMLSNNLRRKKEDLELEKDKLFSKKYLQLKESLNPMTSMPYSDEYIRSKLMKNLDFVTLREQVTKINYDINRLQTCLTAFQQRSELIKSLIYKNR